MFERILPYMRLSFRWNGLHPGPHDPMLRMSFQEIHLPFDPMQIADVIAVHSDDVLAVRSGNSHYQAAGNACIHFFADQPDPWVLVLLDDSNRIVGGTIII